MALPGSRHPLAAAFLACSLLPSRTLHPSQAARLLPAGLLPHCTELPTLHRHWSEHLIQSLALAPLNNCDDPALPLAMLQETALERLGLTAGALLVSHRIRLCISKQEVCFWRQQLGDPIYEFICHRAVALLPGRQDYDLSPDDEIPSSLVRIGYILIFRALDSASPAVRQRARLRLPAEVTENAASYPLHYPLPADAALPLTLNLLQEIEPEWLSLFPTIH